MFQHEYIKDFMIRNSNINSTFLSVRMKRLYTWILYQNLTYVFLGGILIHRIPWIWSEQERVALQERKESSFCKNWQATYNKYQIARNLINCENPTQRNSTQNNSKVTSVGVRHSSHVFHHPTHPTTNFPATSRTARELET